jgi:hypothetical protein
MFGRLGPALDAGFFIVPSLFKEKSGWTFRQARDGSDDPDAEIFDN